MLECTGATSGGQRQTADEDSEGGKADTATGLRGADGDAWQRRQVPWKAATEGLQGVLVERRSGRSG
eukprot:10373121-Heterocapsa_arctica.AAC.1